MELRFPWVSIQELTTTGTEHSSLVADLINSWRFDHIQIIRDKL